MTVTSASRVATDALRREGRRPGRYLAVALVRLRYRLEQLAPGEAPAVAAAPPPATMP